MSFAFYHNFVHHVKCVLTVPFGNTFKTVKTKWVIQTKRTFSDKSGKKPHEYNLNLDKCIFDKGNHPILYYDINKTEPIDFSAIYKKGKGESSNLYYNYMNDKSGEEALNKSANKNMLLVIIILVVIIAGVGIFAQYELSMANDKILSLTRYITTVLANVTKSPVVIR